MAGDKPSFTEWQADQAAILIRELSAKNSQLHDVCIDLLDLCEHNLMTHFPTRVGRARAALEEKP